MKMAKQVSVCSLIILSACGSGGGVEESAVVSEPPKPVDASKPLEPSKPVEQPVSTPTGPTTIQRPVEPPRAQQPATPVAAPSYPHSVTADQVLQAIRTGVGNKTLNGDNDQR